MLASDFINKILTDIIGRLTTDAGLAALAAAGRRLRNSGHGDVVGFRLGMGLEKCKRDCYS